jgi:hypothetical protein
MRNRGDSSLKPCLGTLSQDNSQIFRSVPRWPCWLASSARLGARRRVLDSLAKAVAAEDRVALPRLRFLWVRAREVFPPQRLASSGRLGQFFDKSVPGQQRIRLAQCVGAATGPALVPRVGHDAGVNGIALDVPPTTQQVRFRLAGKDSDRALPGWLESNLSHGRAKSGETNYLAFVDAARSYVNCPRFTLPFGEAHRQCP